MLHFTACGAAAAFSYITFHLCNTSTNLHSEFSLIGAHSRELVSVNIKRLKKSLNVYFFEGAAPLSPFGIWINGILVAHNIHACTYFKHKIGSLRVFVLCISFSFCYSLQPHATLHPLKNGFTRKR